MNSKSSGAMDKSSSYLNFLFNWGIYFLVIILFLLLIIEVKTISELIYPAFILVKNFLFEEKNSLSTIILFSIITKFLLLSCSTYLIFVFFSVITTIISYNSYKSSADKYDYLKFSLEKILIKGINWNFYRTFYVLTPHIIVLTTGILIFLAVLYFFNFYLLFTGWNLGLATFISSFIFISFLFCFIFASILSVYNLMSTLFGIECAVSEPDLPNNTIKNRSIRLSFNTFSNFIFYLLNFAFIIFVIAQFIMATAFKNTVNSSNIANIIIIFMLDILFLFGLSRLKAHLYIESLLKQYKMITINSKGIDF